MLDVHWISLIIFCAFSWFCGMVQGAFVMIVIIQTFGSRQLNEMFYEEFKTLNDIYGGDE